MFKFKQDRQNLNESHSNKSASEADVHVSQVTEQPVIPIFDVSPQ